jgi:glyoxylase-like metal-dependent hydrolase (beta-lactamase superfamily II)
MISSEIENITITHVTDEILFVHQNIPPSYFSCCDGLIILPKKKRNQFSIALDLNIEPYLIDKINELYGPFSDYVCSHGHMDHIAHVHRWEKNGARIFAPQPEDTYLTDLTNFYKGFKFDTALDFAVIEKFAILNGYRRCERVNAFTPGEILKFEDFIIDTISFSGHSKSHIGLLLPKERVLHISCLGFDLSKPNSDGFGPWYGFEECSIPQYLEDINTAESIFLDQAGFLTSSHSYIVKYPDIFPFSYMREKINKNQNLIDHEIMNLKQIKDMKVMINDLLKLDLFFPKKKMKGFLFDIYKFWEFGIISKHLERSEFLK